MDSAKGDTISKDLITQPSKKRKLERDSESSKNESEQATVSAEIESDSSEDEKIYDLTIGKFPKDWNFPRIQEFVQEICGPVDMIEMLRDKDLKFNGKICLTFDSSEKCIKAAQGIRNKEVGGKRLVATFDGIDKPLESEVTGIVSKKQKIKEEPNFSPSTCKSDSYSLNPAFLKRLDITLPIDKWVVVSNFTCDKSELRELMELAGHVVWCVVYHQADRYARVLYNHPLEAVQAVSMLNGQTYFGKTLKVVMEKQPSNAVILPQGLTSIGPGLGKYGWPVRNISTQYDKLANGQVSDLNLNFFNANQSDVQLYDPKNKRPFKLVNVAELKKMNQKSSLVLNSKEKNDAGAKTVQKEADVKKISDSDKRKSMVPAFLQASIGLASAPLPPGVSRLEIAKQNPNFQNGGGQNPVGSGPSAIGPGPSQMIPRPMGPRGPGPMGPGPMVPGPMGPGPMGPGNMGPSPIGPRPMGPGPMGPGPMGPRPMGPGPMGPGPMVPGPMASGPRPMGPGPMVPRQMGPGPRFGPGPMAGPRPAPGPGPGPVFGPRPGPMGGPMGPRPNVPHGIDLATVYFSNLPPTTTFPYMSERLSKVGQVMSLNFTTPGCAVVRFLHPAQADKCIHLVLHRG